MGEGGVSQKVTQSDRGRGILAFLCKPIATLFMDGIQEIILLRVLLKSINPCLNSAGLKQSTCLNKQVKFTETKYGSNKRTLIISMQRRFLKFASCIQHWQILKEFRHFILFLADVFHKSLLTRWEFIAKWTQMAAI